MSKYHIRISRPIQSWKWYEWNNFYWEVVHEDGPGWIARGWTLTLKAAERQAKKALAVAQFEYHPKENKD